MSCRLVDSCRLIYHAHFLLWALLTSYWWIVDISCWWISWWYQSVDWRWWWGFSQAGGYLMFVFSEFRTDGSPTNASCCLGFESWNFVLTNIACWFSNTISQYGNFAVRTVVDLVPICRSCWLVLLTSEFFLVDMGWWIASSLGFVHTDVLHCWLVWNFVLILTNILCVGRVRYSYCGGYCYCSQWCRVCAAWYCWWGRLSRLRLVANMCVDVYATWFMRYFKRINSAYGYTTLITIIHRHVFF